METMGDVQEAREQSHATIVDVILIEARGAKESILAQKTHVQRLATKQRRKNAGVP